MKEVERYAELMRQPDAVFVFGSNRQGIHGGGAARAAYEKYGAIWGVGEGVQGQSYAIPTMDTVGQELTLDGLRPYVARFLRYAEQHPGFTFVLTRVGCGIAGFTDTDIAPLFAGASANVILPTQWEGIA